MESLPAEGRLSFFDVSKLGGFFVLREFLSFCNMSTLTSFVNTMDKGVFLWSDKAIF